MEVGSGGGTITKKYSVVGIIGLEAIPALL